MSDRALWLVLGLYVFALCVTAFLSVLGAPIWMRWTARLSASCVLLAALAVRRWLERQ